MYEAYFIAVVVDIVLAAWVWIDAGQRGDPHAAWWALGTFLIVIVVLPLYLYHRAYGPPQTRDETETVEEEPTGKDYAVTCRCGHVIEAYIDFDEEVQCKRCGQRYKASRDEPELVPISRSSAKG